jgi:hypothetical protein
LWCIPLRFESRDILTPTATNTIPRAIRPLPRRTKKKISEMWLWKLWGAAALRLAITRSEEEEVMVLMLVTIMTALDILMMDMKILGQWNWDMLLIPIMTIMSKTWA